MPPEVSVSASSSWASVHSTRSCMSGLSYAVAEIAGTLTPSKTIRFARVTPVTARTMGLALETIRPKFRRLNLNLLAMC